MIKKNVFSFRNTRMLKSLCFVNQKQTHFKLICKKRPIITRFMNVIRQAQYDENIDYVEINLLQSSKE